MSEVPDAAALLEKWRRILVVRAVAQKELEALRQQGKIGSSLQAEITIAAADDEYAALASLGDDLRFVLNTSAAHVERGDTLVVAVNPSAHTKCARCWHWRDDVGDDSAHPTLCGRCVANLFGAGEPRVYA